MFTQPLLFYVLDEETGLKRPLISHMKYTLGKTKDKDINKTQKT